MRCECVCVCVCVRACVCVRVLCSFVWCACVVLCCQLQAPDRAAHLQALRAHLTISEDTLVAVGESGGSEGIWWR